MRTGLNIIKDKIGLKLTDGLIQSFIYNKQITDKINVTYLKFDNWVHITTTDETAVLAIGEEHPTQIESWTEEDGNTADYPLTPIIEEYPDFSKFIGRTLTSVTELKSRSNSLTCGIKLMFTDRYILTYSDDNEQSYIVFDGPIPHELIETK